jgi:aryl-alcohol dehydrogenase-like predicted oxidoreductase
LLKSFIRKYWCKQIRLFFFHRYIDLVNFSSTQKLSSSFINDHSLGLAASIYSDDEFRFALGCNFVKAVQIPFNIFDSSSEKLDLMREACQKGVKVYCRSVFLQGLFFMNPLELPEKLKKFGPYLIGLDEISKSFGISKMSLALNFAKQFPEIDGVLIGVDNKSQLQANLQAWKEDCSLTAMEKMRELVFPDKELLMPKNW